MSALKLTWIGKIHQHDTNHKWENTALVKYPLVKNKEHYGPRVTNGYSKYNAFWTQVFTFLMHKHWIDKGVHCVAHFLNELGEVLCHIDFQRKLDITIDFVTYSGCILCIFFLFIITML